MKTASYNFRMIDIKLKHRQALAKPITAPVKLLLKKRLHLLNKCQRMSPFSRFNKRFYNYDLLRKSLSSASLLPMEMKSPFNFSN